jgi:hypothetical protein
MVRLFTAKRENLSGIIQCCDKEASEVGLLVPVKKKKKKKRERERERAAKCKV